MSEASDATIAVFLDLENVAIGAKDAGFEAFDIRLVLERLLLRGHLVVKKAYCNFDRYKEFKRGLHETAFELIEIPHTRQAGKNSADIRMVVDALDLCYTKQHIDTFAIVSGDSDFSPLVSKLRENAKTVVGVGVKQSSSDLFISNCDVFLYYDDLVRGKPKKTSAPSKAKPKDKKGPTREEALEQLCDTLAVLEEERGDNPIWGSMIKQAIKRRNPGFNERAHSFASFRELLEAAQKQGLLTLETHAKTPDFTVRLVKQG